MHAEVHAALPSGTAGIFVDAIRASDCAMHADDAEAALTPLELDPVEVQVFVDLYLKTKEVERQSAYQQWLLDEHAPPPPWLAPGLPPLQETIRRFFSCIHRA